MATFVKTFVFTGSAEGWTFTSGGNATGTAQNNRLEVDNSGRNKTDDGHWTWTGTFEDLGLPAGATITGYSNAGFDGESLTWNVVDAGGHRDVGTEGAFSINDGTIRTLVADQSDYTAASQTRTPSGDPGISGLSLASTTSITLYLHHYLENGNNASAQAEIAWDNVTLSVEYSPPPTVVQPTFITSAETWYDPAVVPTGSAPVTPDLITTTETWYDPNVQKSSIEPEFIATTETWYDPAVTYDYRGVFFNTTQSESGWVRQTVTNWTDTAIEFTGVQGTLPDDTDLEFAVRDRDGNITWSALSPKPQFTGGAISVQPTLITTTETWYDPSVVATGTADPIIPDFIATTETWYDPSVVATGSVAITPDLITTTETWYDPSVVATGSVAITPDLITTTETWYDPSVVATGTADPIIPDFIATTETWYDPSVVGTGTADPIIPDFIATTETWYDPAVVVGATLVDPEFIATAETWYEPAVVATGSVAITPDFIATAETWYEPDVVPAGAAPITPDLITTEETWYEPTLAGTGTAPLLAGHGAISIVWRDALVEGQYRLHGSPDKTKGFYESGNLNSQTPGGLWHHGADPDGDWLPKLWTTGTVYAVDDYVKVSQSSYQVYKCTSGGTSGATPPSGTGTGISDGGCIWDYYQADPGSDLRPKQSDWNAGYTNGTGFMGNLAQPGGAGAYDDGPALVTRTASIKHHVPNDETSWSGDPADNLTGPPWSWEQLQDGNKDRRRNEVTTGTSADNDATTGTSHGEARAEHLLGFATYLPEDFDLTPANNPEELTLVQFKDFSDGLPCFTIGLLDGVYVATHVSHPEYNNDWAHIPTWAYGKYGQIYVDDAEGDYDDLNGDYGAGGLAALNTVTRGRWTFWAVHFKADLRTSAQGGTGFFKLYKRTEREANWTLVLDIAPRNQTIGAQSGDRGVLLQNAPGVVTTYDARGQWTTGSAYSLNDRVWNAGEIYECTTAGTSGGTPPTGTGTGINDGGCVWQSIEPYNGIYSRHGIYNIAPAFTTRDARPAVTLYTGALVYTDPADTHLDGLYASMVGPTVESAEDVYEPQLLAGVVVVEPTDITTTETWYDPTVAATGSAPVTPDLITTEETWYDPALALTYYVDPEFIATEETWYDPAVVATGSVAITPDLITTEETWYDPAVVATGSVAITPDLITTEETWYDPAVVAVGENTILPGFIATAETWYDPTVAATGSAPVTPDLITTEETWYDPALALTYYVDPEFIATAETWYDPAVVGQTTIVEPGFITTEETWYDPALALTYYVDPEFITTAETWYDPSVVGTGTVPITPSFIVTEETWYEPAVVAVGENTITPDFVATAEAWFDPAVVPAGAAPVTPDAIGTSESVYEPALVPQTYTVAVDPSIASSEAVYAPEVVGVGANTILPEEITTAETWYDPAVVAAGIAPITPDFLASAEAWYQPSVVGTGSIPVTPDAITTEETWYDPALALTYYVDPEFITTEETWYDPTVIPGVVLLVEFITSEETWYDPAVVATGIGPVVTVDFITSEEQVYEPLAAFGTQVFWSFFQMIWEKLLDRKGRTVTLYHYEDGAEETYQVKASVHRSRNNPRQTQIMGGGETGAMDEDLWHVVISYKELVDANWTSDRTIEPPDRLFFDGNYHAVRSIYPMYSGEDLLGFRVQVKG